MIKWDFPSDTESLETFSCRICGAIIGLRWGISPNPTDTSDLHTDWHRTHGDNGDV